MGLLAEEFRRQAATAGFPVKTMNVYRLDARPPEAIRAALGMSPNPTKPALSMREHVRPGCTGGSLFVSTCVHAGHLHNVRSADFITGNDLRRPTDADAVAWMNGVSSRVQASLLGVFEYEIVGVQAAIVTGGGVADEQEALIGGAALHEVPRFRRVFVRMPGRKIEDSDYRTFVSLRDAQVRLGSWQRL